MSATPARDSPSRRCASPAPSRTSCAPRRPPASPASRCSSTTSSCRPGRPAGCGRRRPASACRSRSTSRSTSRRFRPTCSRRTCAVPSGSSTCWSSSGRACWCAARRGPRAAVDDDDLAAEQLHALAGRAEQRGLRIAYEAVPWGRLRTHRGCLANRAARRPSGARAVPRQLPCAVPGRRSRRVIAQSPATRCSTSSSRMRRG